jgi:hypothetical protein
MEKEQKIKAFEEELNFIINPQIRLFAETAIGSLPDYFFVIPSSSSNKYHPAYANGIGGLVRHSKAATRIAVELFRTDLWLFTDDEKDLILTGLMIHDGYKSGIVQEKFSRADHPKIVAFEISNNNELLGLITSEQMQFVANNLAKHMGKWVEDYRTHEQILDKPKTTAERFTSLCDYLASRKCLLFDFDAEISKS